MKRVNTKLLAGLLALACVPAAAQVIAPSEPVDVANERQAPEAVVVDAPIATATAAEAGTPPFGHNLFTQMTFAAEREDGLNPDYLIQPGDRITLRIWGAISVNELVVVDAQGNIFVPEVGPIRVEGARNAELNSRITDALKRVFTQNVSVYTNLEATTPVLVFVTGFVNRPGSYAGVASDSALFFLARAGGIDAERGSYRNVRILRGGETIATVDLYQFLVDGVLPRPQFTDGDTIVVERRGDAVTAEGSVRNAFAFEIPNEGISGRELIHYARPWANASYATVLGTRENGPLSIYVSLAELENIQLRDGDQVIFEVDQVHDTILVRVEGSHIGQSRFAVPRDAHLLQVLDYIKVDPALADLQSISLRRESIKKRQYAALQESLVRLETAIMSKSPITREGAEIQVKEAELLAAFIARARQVEPQGILVVAKDGQIEDVLLQPNDVITIPEKTNVVQISGEVMVPQALVYNEGASLRDYIARVGGYTERADRSRHMIMRRNGEVIPLFGGSSNVDIRPGDEIISLPSVPSRSAEIVQIVTETMFRIASAAAIFIRL